MIVCYDDMESYVLYPIKSNVGHRELFASHDHTHPVRILRISDRDVPEDNIWMIIVIIVMMYDLIKIQRISDCDVPEEKKLV